MSPYTGSTFFNFFTKLFSRLIEFFSEPKLFSIATDEVQVLSLIGIALSCSLVGCFLTLKKMTMLANSLSHSILLGIALSSLLSIKLSSSSEHLHLSISKLVLAALISAVLTSFLTEFLHKTMRLKEDASNGLVFSSLFAVGIIIISVFMRNSHIGAETIMGNVDALRKEDITAVYFVALLNCLLVFLFYKEYQITAFDQEFSKSLGLSPRFFTYLLMLQTALSSTASFRAVGVVMVLAFIVIPCLTAAFFTKRLGNLIILSFFTSSLAALCGVALSRHILTIYGIPLSTGGLTVSLLAFFFILAAFFSPQRGIACKYFRQFHRREEKTYATISG